MKGRALSRFVRNPLSAAAVVFLAFFVTRFVAAAPFESSIYYMWDGILDTCVKPWQLLTGQPFAGDDNAYLAILASTAVYQLSGYSARHLEIFLCFIAAGSMAVLFEAFRRMLGVAPAWRTMAVLLVSTPLATLALVPVNTASGFWGFSLVVLCLMLEPSRRRDFALALSCTVTLFCYAGGVVTIVPLLLFHVLFFRRRWPLLRMISFGGMMMGGLALVWTARHIASGRGNFTHWSADNLQRPPFTRYHEALRVMVRDLFWSADTWNSGADGLPYLNILFALLLAVGIARSIQVLIARRQARNTSLTEAEKWPLVFFLVFWAAAFLAAIDVATPGIRRVYPAVILLCVIIGLAPGFAWRSIWWSRFLHLIFAVALVWDATAGVRIARSRWNPPPPVSWVAVADQLVKELTKLEKPATLVVDRMAEPALDRVFCRVYLDENARAKTDGLYGLDRFSDGEVSLCENGEISRPATPELKAGFLFVTKSRKRADEMLPALQQLVPPPDGPPRIVLVSDGSDAAPPAIKRDPRYPAQWWAPASKQDAPSWEILPQEAGLDEVILSKRNELGLLSNLAATPFEFRGQRYASLEGFWQMMKYPEGPDDQRNLFPGMEWKYTRAQVAALSGMEAKAAGNLANANLKRMGATWGTFAGIQFEFRPDLPGEHYQLIVEATRAKVDQNPEVKKVLLSTGHLILKPDHHQEPSPPPAWRYYEILTQIRSELAGKESHP